MAEPAAVAEHVQHAAIAEIAGGRHAVLALVEIEARLLPFGQIDLVLQAVSTITSGPSGILPQYGPSRSSIPSARLTPRSVRIMMPCGCGQFDQHGHDLRQPHGHRQGRDLNGEIIGIAIDDQAAQPVALAEDQSGRALRIVVAELLGGSATAASSRRRQKASSSVSAASQV